MSTASSKLRRAPRDPTVYPVADDMPETGSHREITNLLQSLVRRYCALEGRRAYVGCSQFIYWVQHQPTLNVAPDLYVLPGQDPHADPDCWKVWETGIVPSLVVEVVSRQVLKDYERSPLRYEALGVEELVVFDPDWQGHRERIRWQLWRRLRRRGFTRVEATNHDRIRSRVLGCWLRSLDDGSMTRVRIGLDPGGDALLPTDGEAADAEQAARAQAEALCEAERAARLRLEAELSALRTQLTKPGRTRSERKRKTQ
jgi:Uma2 family endonuclease